MDFKRRCNDLLGNPFVSKDFFYLSVFHQCFIRGSGFLFSPGGCVGLTVYHRVAAVAKQTFRESRNAIGATAYCFFASR